MDLYDDLIEEEQAAGAKVTKGGGGGMDLYGELIEERAGETDRLRAEVTKLKTDLAKLTEDNKCWLVINTDLRNKINQAAKNMSILIKTCRAEINRKNKTILELRNELESGMLKKAGSGRGGISRAQVQTMLDNIKDSYRRMEKLEVNGGKHTLH